MFSFWQCACKHQPRSKQHSRVEGTITDQNGAPVSGAEVTLSIKSFTSTATTNGEGRFAFDSVSPGNGTITVRATGFSTLERKWSADDKALSLTLAPAALSDQITVTAERTLSRVSDTAASVLVLSTEDVTTTAALTLDDVLRQVPGFTLFRRSGSRTANPTSQGVSLRGVGASGASRAVVLSDGIPINDPFGGWVYWGRVPRESVSRIEVVQGGASHLYGTDALGGVINFIPRDARDGALSFEASYGNQQTPDVSLFAGGRLFQWSAQLAAEVFHTDGYIIVDERERGPVDVRAGGEHTTLDLTLERSLSDKGRVFVRGGIFGESRENGTPLQTNRTHIRQLAAGSDWQSQVARLVFVASLRQRANLRSRLFGHRSHARDRNIDAQPARACSTTRFHFAVVARSRFAPDSGRRIRCARSARRKRRACIRRRQSHIGSRRGRARADCRSIRAGHHSHHAAMVCHAGRAL